MKSKVRDRIALGVPTDADDNLVELFLDQIKTLGDIVQELKVPGPVVYIVSILTRA